MRRLASEVLRDLEIRIARLENQASNRTASSKFTVSMNTGDKEKMSVKDLLTLLKDTQDMSDDRCVASIIPNGIRSKIKFRCGDWSCFVDMFDFVGAIDHRHIEMESAYDLDASIKDDGLYDAEKLALTVKDYLSGLLLGWSVKVI